jgi:predicted metal-dependent peptidase
MNEQMTDPFATIEHAAKRLAAEQHAAKAVSQARGTLIIDRSARGAFFSTLSMALKPEPSWAIDTAATNGKLLLYNPDFVNALGLEKLIGLVVHEVMHVANKHQCRLQGRDARRWNEACDLAINSIILDSGFKLPNDGCVPGRNQHKEFPKGLSADDYYTRLQAQKPEPQDDGKGNQDPGGCGAVLPAGDGSEAASRESEADWNVKVLQAGEVARRRGELPAGVDRMVGDIKNPKVDWRDVLREFVTVLARNDYAWSPPNRRFIHLGMYLPGMRSEELGDIVVAVDTSGSIDEKTLSVFASEMQGILDSFDCTLKILYHDSAIAGTQVWKSSDGPLVLTPAGGGGTDHRPVFKHIEESGEDPTCLVCLTDMESCFPKQEPGYPVLWCSTTEGSTGPFGRTVCIN